MITLSDQMATWQQTTDATQQIVGVLNKAKAEDRHRVLEDMRKHFNIPDSAIDPPSARRQQSAIAEILAWWKLVPKNAPWRFQSIDCSVTHQLQESRTTVASDAGGKEDTASIVAALTTAQIFIIQHDWAAAFASAQGLDGTEARLPYDVCAFEFSAESKRGIAVCRDNSLRPDIFLRMQDGWIHLVGSIEVTPILELVRCACIALDAQVAVTDITRAPAALNKRRADKNKPPLRDFHTIRLTDRQRRTRPETPGIVDRQRPRLHFRRAHDRYYATYMVRIPWTLVGDPDLGFIDKDYRL